MAFFYNCAFFKIIIAGFCDFICFSLNKSYLDMGNQLHLFIDEEQNWCMS